MGISDKKHTQEKNTHNVTIARFNNENSDSMINKNNIADRS